MPTTWLVTTPEGRTLVEVSADRCVAHTAPYREVTWWWGAWDGLRAWLEARWGSQVTFRQLV